MPTPPRLSSTTYRLDLPFRAASGTSVPKTAARSASVPSASPASVPSATGPSAPSRKAAPLPAHARCGSARIEDRRGSERSAAERRLAARRGGPSTDPGPEPALAAEGGRAPDRRRVSIRWLCGTILAGVFGAGLMGGAVVATLDGTSTTQRAALAPAPGEGRGGGASNVGRKTDRMLAQSDAITARQTVRISTTTRVGDREVIKVKPFTRVIANLALSAGSLADEVPPFNPAALVAGDGQAPDEEDAPDAQGLAAEAAAPDDGEVSVKSTSLAALALGPDRGLTVPADRLRALARAQVASAAGALPGAASAAEAALPLQLLTVGLTAGPSSPAATLAYAVQELGAAAALDVRITPENLTEIGKSPASNAPVERTVVVGGGDTLGSIVKAAGGTPDQALAIGRALGEAGGLTAGQRLRILTTPVEADDGRREPVRVSVYTADTHVATVALSDAGDYVAIEDPDAPVGGTQADEEDEGDEDGGGLRLYDSIYETALHQQVPRPMIDALIRIYAYDVDLTRRARPGDTFEVFYGPGEEGDTGDVLYTSLGIGGELKRYYRFESGEGQADYYDADGKSARKFLMRKPVNGGRMSSPFGFRTHPILGYAKLHTGTDWAEPVGTPIMATGNGDVSMAGDKSGYGRHVEIQHANGYVTTYSHMSAFARGIQPGVRVRMGQVIGYVGTSGLSTGAHVHYEVKINGNFVDSMRIKLPQGRELDGGELAAFRRERERVDAMMNRTPGAEAAVEAGRKT